jgi:OOP family OmpA-OmpF porin
MRTTIIQLIGIFSILLLFFFSLPLYNEYISLIINNKVKQSLQENNLSWVKVVTNEREVVLSGETTKSDEHQKALQLVRSLWFVKSIKDDINPLVVKPYRMNISWDSDKLSLKGYIVNNKEREKIKREVNKDFTGKEIEFSLETAQGAPDGWMELNIALLKSIMNLPLASIRIIDKTVTIAGKVDTYKESKNLQQKIDRFKEKGYVIDFEIVSLDMARVVCQKKFDQLLSSDTIYFLTGTATIESRSYNLLRQIADIAVLCPNAKLLISGHTDNVGDPLTNLTLSLQRANAVKGYLFSEGGVPLNRLKATGKGEDYPIADNTTKEGRAKNRRIEIKVTGI